jgi:S1-C subfamily serine protease
LVAVNLFDLGALALVVAAIVVGFRSGALPQIGGLLGAVGGGALAILLLPLVVRPLDGLDPTIRAFAVLGGILLFVGIGEAIGSAGGHAIGSRLGRGVLNAADRVFGGLVGAGQALLIVWLAGGLLAAGPVPRVAAQAQTSFTVRALTAVLTTPTELAAELGRLLDASGLPDVFIGLEPLPAPPVELPPDPEARAIARDAEPSTVKVTASTCGLLSTGTGFAVGPGYFVTNAHVVAGGRTIRLSTGSRVADASAVLFDSRHDLALLFAPRLDAPALRLASTDPARGTTGATLGHPAGGGLRVSPAAVAGRYEAQGRDIYGGDRVTRTVIELRARVDQGDSGGPFVLADGDVGGIVFAEARTDEDVGYALSAAELAPAIRAAVGTTTPADTGHCIR